MGALVVQAWTSWVIPSGPSTTRRGSSVLGAVSHTSSCVPGNEKTWPSQPAGPVAHAPCRVLARGSEGRQQRRGGAGEHAGAWPHAGVRGLKGGRAEGKAVTPATFPAAGASSGVSFTYRASAEHGTIRSTEL